MRHWKIPSLLTALILITLFIGSLFVFNIGISVPSSDIEFSPGETKSQLNSEPDSIKPKNIIIFIADGMGFSHLSLALLTQQTDSSSSVWQEFDIKGWHDPRAAYGPLTDSEASATAMATGTSTFFGHISLDQEGKHLPTLFEQASEQEYNTGIVTDSYIWDGTPAAFVAHSKNEDNARDILSQMASSELDLIFGELEDLGEGLVPEKEETFDILTKRFQILDASLALPKQDNVLQPIAAIFSEDEIQDLNSKPNLPQLTEAALEYLSASNQPFVLLVEGEELDSASHTNDSKRVLKGLQSIQKTLALILGFSKINGETLVLFTSDHETGGLAAVADFDAYPEMQIKWATKDHTGAVVPLFAQGPGAKAFSKVHRNWEIGKLLKSMISSD